MSRFLMADTKFNIFVVDDDESVRDSLRLMLESSGYPVSAFKSAEDLLDSGFGENSF
jgi:FixJ family two-component response regulator